MSPDLKSISDCCLLYSVSGVVYEVKACPGNGCQNLKSMWWLLVLQSYGAIKYPVVCLLTWSFFFFISQTESMSVSQSSENDTSEIKVICTCLQVMRKWLFYDALMTFCITFDCWFLSKWLFIFIFLSQSSEETSSSQVSYLLTYWKYVWKCNDMLSMCLNSPFIIVIFTESEFRVRICRNHIRGHGGFYHHSFSCLYLFFIFIF